MGGLASGDEVERRLGQALELADLSPAQFVETLLPTMFSASTPADVVDAFAATMLEFHPAGFRAMARASAENLRDVLPRIHVPTLLLYGDVDLRAPRRVAEDLHAAIAGSTLVMLEGIGHVCNIEAPERFNDEVRRFARSLQG